jgi:phage tail protein X
LEHDDVDAIWYQVLDITGAKFRQAMVVDNILREFSSNEGLADFGQMLTNGTFHELTDAWERFKNDTDIEGEDWFQREVQDFMGKRL